MGGYGSTRWGWQRTRNDIGGRLWLDIRRLHKQGGLRPGAITAQAWGLRGEPVGNIATVTDQDRKTVTLAYQTRRPGEPWQAVQEPIDLDWTPCHYGGERPWFRCPGCWTRRAVLYSVGGVFRCRGCHDLAYSSSRESEFDRAIRRADKLRARLGDTSTGAVWRFPETAKPAGMHWSTYVRLVNEMIVAVDDVAKLARADFEALTLRCDRLLSRQRGAR